jgi:hypothetical protein
VFQPLMTTKKTRALKSRPLHLNEPRPSSPPWTLIWCQSHQSSCRPLFMNVHIKLECLSLAGLSSLIPMGLYHKTFYGHNLGVGRTWDGPCQINKCETWLGGTNTLAYTGPSAMMNKNFDFDTRCHCYIKVLNHH